MALSTMRGAFRDPASRAIRGAVSRVLSASARRRLAARVSRLTLLPDEKREAFCFLVLGDLMQTNNKAMHKYLWTNHLAYATYYELRYRFDGVEPSRELLFADVQRQLRSIGREPDQVNSVLEIGCSLGYNLRYLERGLFAHVPELHGFDLDGAAIRAGSAYLAAAGSRIRLFEGDMEHLDELVGDRGYDVVYCAGVLLYLDAADAAQVVAAILRRTRLLAALTAVPSPTRDNALLDYSEMREWNSTHIHNLDRMVSDGGGAVVGRRYQLEPTPAYWVLAQPASDLGE